MYFCGVKLKKDRIMNAVQMNALNAQIWRDMGTIATDEGMMRRVAKYLRKVVKEMTYDPTAMSEEEFLAKLERGEEAYRQGNTHHINSLEELDQFINSL